MTDKYEDKNDFSIDEEKPRNIFSLRQETDFYHDEDNVIHDIISVKRVKLPKNGENWDILKNKKIEFTLKGIRFTNKEKEYLRTAEGILFILNSYKEGLRSINAYKEKLRKCLK